MLHSSSKFPRVGQPEEEDQSSKAGLVAVLYLLWKSPSLSRMYTKNHPCLLCACGRTVTAKRLTIKHVISQGFGSTGGGWRRPAAHSGLGIVSTDGWIATIVQVNLGPVQRGHPLVAVRMKGFGMRIVGTSLSPLAFVTVVWKQGCVCNGSWCYLNDPGWQ
jgi:hypothetical protein